MNNQEITPKKFADSLFGPDDERKATCIHCGSEWYEIHFKDGVCHGCQQKKLPGREQIAKRARKQNLLLALVIMVIAAALLYVFL